MKNGGHHTTLKLREPAPPRYRRAPRPVHRVRPDDDPTFRRVIATPPPPVGQDSSSPPDEPREPDDDVTNPPGDLRRNLFVAVAAVVFLALGIVFVATRSSHSATVHLAGRERIAAPKIGAGTDMTAAVSRFWATAVSERPHPQVLTLPVPERVPSDPTDQGDLPDLGRVVIPRIGLSTTLYQGVSLASINRGPAFWPGTALPGELGNMVIAGHRVSYSKPFHDIDQLQIGDDVFVTDYHRGDFRYQVTQTEIVDARQMDIISQPIAYEGTLFACHPPGSTKYRYVVRLRLVDINGNPVEVPAYRVVRT